MSFKFKVKTDNSGISSNNQFILPLRVGQTYNFDINWGDGIVETIISNTSITHTYALIGTYEISITENIVGGFPAIYFNNTGDKLKIIDLTEWGTNKWLSFEGAFYGCSNMIISAIDHNTAVTQYVELFNNAWRVCSSLTSFPLLNTSAAINFNATWRDCSSLISFPLLNTYNVTTFDSSWQNCTGLTNFPLLNSSKVTSFTNSWYNCNKLTSFPLLDSSKVTSFYCAWYNCTSLTVFPLLNMSKMLNGTGAFTSVILNSTSYSDILENLFLTNTNVGVSFNAGNNSKYYPRAAADRTILVSMRNWTITDGGQSTEIESPQYTDLDKYSESLSLSIMTMLTILLSILTKSYSKEDIVNIVKNVLKIE
jgi:hypothetical protein